MFEDVLEGQFSVFIFCGYTVGWLIGKAQKIKDFIANVGDTIDKNDRNVISRRITTH